MNSLQTPLQTQLNPPLPQAQGCQLGAIKQLQSGLELQLNKRSKIPLQQRPAAPLFPTAGADLVQQLE